jgi:hypothetical protein
MILVALAIFQTWIRVGVGIDKLLIDLGFRNFFGTKIIWSRSVLTSCGLAVLLHYSNGLKSAHRETRTH